MTQPKKIRVAVLYGGRSGEHEVSLRSAASVIRHLDRSRFEVIPVAIDKQGKWYLNDLSLLGDGSILPVLKEAPVTLLPNPEKNTRALTPIGTAISGSDASAKFDVVFPVMHGTNAEDGTIQGLFELAEIPYVGCGVLASSVGMDKDVAKRLIKEAGLPIVPYVVTRKDFWEKNFSALEKRVERELGFPCFVKPSNAGSSVGVHKVKEAGSLRSALEDSFRYDTKVLIEKAIDAREIEVAVLENIDNCEIPLASIPGEITPTHEFYSYEAKYLDENGAALSIPAKLTESEVRHVQTLARRAFVTLEGEGMMRVDLFISRSTGEIYFNEVNTIPGFTSISMYPKMWEASGLSYSELLTKLIELALARHQKRSRLVRDFLGKA